MNYLDEIMAREQLKDRLRTAERDRLIQGLRATSERPSLGQRLRSWLAANHRASQRRRIGNEAVGLPHIDQCTMETHQ